MIPWFQIVIIASGILSSAVIEKIDVVTIVCGAHMHQFGQWFSSVILNTNHTLIQMKLNIFVDVAAFSFASKCISKMQQLVDIEFYKLEAFVLPALEALKDPRFRCAVYKLNLPAMMENATKIIWMDVDILVLEDLSNLWNRFNADETKIVWAALETYGDPRTGWYMSHKKTTFFPPCGINSGVLLLNLEAMRKSNITVQNMIRNHTDIVTLPDQDILNTWAYYNQGKVGILPCKWNKRVRSNCSEFVSENPVIPAQNGIFHGSNGALQGPHNWNLRFPFLQFFDRMCES